MTNNCQICTETYNKSTRIKVICPYGDCSYESCKLCIRTYILNTTTDPHCMNCRKALNQNFLIENLNRSFFGGEYKKHRKKLLLENELSRMPDTMAAASRHKLMENEEINYKKQEKICAELRRKLREETIKSHEIKINLNNIRNGSSIVEYSERRKFIMPCSNENCNGYLSSQYKCDLCFMFTCPECFELIGYNKTDQHVCNEDSVKSAQMIKKETKPCPNCGVRIQKQSGCNQMWCVECKTAFNYETLTIDKGPVHNPHFYEWQATLNNGTAPRNPGDVACGGLIRYYQLANLLRLLHQDVDRRFLKLNIIGDNKIYQRDNKLYQLMLNIPALHRTISHITYNDIHYLRNNIRNLENNEQLRIDYILNKKNKENLSDSIYRNDNNRRKYSELLHIYELLSVVGIETFANIILEDFTTNSIPKFYEFINNFNDLRIYCNDLLAKLSVTYNMAVMQINKEFQISQKKIKFTKKNCDANSISNSVASSSSDLG